MVPPPGMAAPAAPAAARPPAGRQIAPAAPAPAVPQPTRPSKKFNPALFAYIALGVIAIGAIAYFAFRQGAGTADEKALSAPLPVIAKKVIAPVPVAPAPVVVEKPVAPPVEAANPPIPTSESTGNVPTASLVWSDSFENGMANWTVTPDASPLTPGIARVVSGTNSAKVSNTLDRMYRDIGWELSGHAKLTFWMYDATQGRAWGELRGYSGKSFGKGSMKQIFSIGRDDISFGNTGTGTLKGETTDKSKYQGRVLLGANAGWFNLDAPGAPSRSTGWHKFEIERLADGKTVNFYVDAVLSRTITGASAAAVNTVDIGSLGTAVSTGSIGGNAWFDDVKVEYFGPAPEAMINAVAAAPKKKTPPPQPQPAKKK